MSTRRRFPTSICIAVLVAAALAPACNGVIIEGQPAPSDPAPSLPGRVPLPGKYLDHTGVLPATHGLFPEENLGSDGKPLLTGSSSHPLIEEARAYGRTLASYAALIPGVGAGDTPNPLTLDAWKHLYKLPVQQAGEALDSFRRNNNVVVYYNKNELGLGRELGCSAFLDRGAWGSACYVTNYGFRFNDREASTRAAQEQLKPRNTVCILYQPSLPDEKKVQFFVFDGNGDRQQWAQLDAMGPRPHPEVCTNCHGGSYDNESHLVVGARFLPLDPDLVSFGTTPYDRASQENAVHAVNALTYDTTVLVDTNHDGLFDTSTTLGASDAQRLSPEQGADIAAMYSVVGEQDIHSLRATARSVRPPQGWTSADPSQNQRLADLYTKVVRPYCVTCHNAVGPGLRSNFRTSDALTNGFLSSAMCTSGQYGMPNAQATMAQLWAHDDGPITVGPNEYAAPADALLVAGIGLEGRSACMNYAEKSSCASPGASGHALCGNDHSGTACSGPSNGACVPDPYLAPETGLPDVWFERQSFDAPTGVCQTSGPRRCPSGQNCVLSQESVTGLPGFDGLCTICGGAGQLACE